MVTCAVPGCGSSRKENPQKYTFHIFPKDIEVQQKWLKMINRGKWVPKKNSTVCSKHFEEKCFSHRVAQRVKLRSGSIPTLFMPVVLKPIRKASSYIYRDISSVPSSTTANVIVLDNYTRMNKMKNTIEILRRRLSMTQKRLKNVKAQKNRADERVRKLSQEIDNLKSITSLQNNISDVIYIKYVESTEAESNH